MKERPGQVDYASSGNGSGQHLFMAHAASSMAGIKLTHVPYKGSGQATTDLLGGMVHGRRCPGTAGMVRHIKAGKLRRAGGHRRASARRSCPTCRRWPNRASPATSLRLARPARAEGHAAGDRRARSNREVIGRAGDARGQDATWPTPASRSSARRRPSSARSSAPRRDRWAQGHHGDRRQGRLTRLIDGTTTPMSQ